MSAPSQVNSRLLSPVKQGACVFDAMPHLLGAIFADLAHLA
jgi:hypothetical protein